MRKVLFTLFYLASFSLTAQWLTDLDRALKFAAENDKFIVVSFSSDCEACVKMDRETLADPEIQKLLDHFIRLRIDADKSENQLLIKKYDVSMLPAVYVLDPGGMQIERLFGFQRKARLKAALSKEMSLSDFINSYQKKFNVRFSDDLLSTAELILDMAVESGNMYKNDLVNLSKAYREQYLNSGQSKDSKQQMQKAGLLDMYEGLIYNAFKKVKKTLGKKEWRSASIGSQNRSLYDFLNYSMAVHSGDKKDAKYWYDRLKQHDNYKLRVLQARKLGKNPSKIPFLAKEDAAKRDFIFFKDPFLFQDNWIVPYLFDNKNNNFIEKEGDFFNIRHKKNSAYYFMVGFWEKKREGRPNNLIVAIRDNANTKISVLKILDDVKVYSQRYGVLTPIKVFEGEYPMVHFARPLNIRNRDEIGTFLENDVLTVEIAGERYDFPSPVTK